MENNELAAESIALSSSGRTDPGRVRPENEDYFLADDQLEFYAVADGMSPTGRGGRVASKTAIRSVWKFLRNYQADIAKWVCADGQESIHKVQRVVRDAVGQACQRVHDLRQEKEEQKGLATTLSLMLVIGSQGVIAHVGDSRIYLLRGDQVHQLTTDHTFVSEQVRMGIIGEDEIPVSPFRGVLTRALGSYERVKVDVSGIHLLPGDRLLLCTNGLHEYATHQTVRELLTDPDSEAAARRCIDYANSCGGKDDITAIVVNVEGNDEDPHARAVHETLDTLCRVCLFRDLTYADLMKLTNICYIKHYAPGETVFTQGTQEERLYILLEGEVRAVRDGVEVGRFAAGTYFGGISFMDRGPRAATITCETQVKLLSITREDFTHLLNQNPELATRLLWNMSLELSGRLRASIETMTRLNQKLVQG